MCAVVGTSRLRARPSGLVMAGLVATALLTGCAGRGGPSDAGEAASSTSAAETSPPELADGLLPAEAFGPEATVVAMTLEQLQQGAGMAGRAKDLQVTPPECAAAVHGTQPDVAAFDDVAAQSATVGTSATVEMLVRGGPTGGSLDQIATAVETCPRAQITSPQFGTATITFENVPVDDLGDGSAALRFTTAVKRPDGASMTVPALVGVVQDADRLVILLNLSQNGTPPDAEAFTALLEQAYEAQAEALD